MIEHIRSYFIIAVAIVLLTTAGRAQNVQAVNDNIMLKEDEAKIIDVLKNDKLDSRDNLDLLYSPHLVLVLQKFKGLIYRIFPMQM